MEEFYFTITCNTPSWVFLTFFEFLLKKESLICQINAVLDSNRILFINPEVGTTAETCLHSLNPRNTS